jgi:hypothetical protein
LAFAAVRVFGLAFATLWARALADFAALALAAGAACPAVPTACGSVMGLGGDFAAGALFATGQGALPTPDLHASAWAADDIAIIPERRKPAVREIVLAKRIPLRTAIHLALYCSGGKQGSVCCGLGK